MFQVALKSTTLCRVDSSFPTSYTLKFISRSCFILQDTQNTGLLWSQFMMFTVQLSSQDTDTTTSTFIISLRQVQEPSPPKLSSLCTWKHSVTSWHLIKTPKQLCLTKRVYIHTYLSTYVMYTQRVLVNHRWFLPTDQEWKPNNKL